MLLLSQGMGRRRLSGTTLALCVMSAATMRFSSLALFCVLLGEIRDPLQRDTVCFQHEKEAIVAGYEWLAASHECLRRSASARPSR